MDLNYLWNASVFLGKSRTKSSAKSEKDREIPEFYTAKKKKKKKRLSPRQREVLCREAVWGDNCWEPPLRPVSLGPQGVAGVALCSLAPRP